MEVSLCFVDIISLRKSRVSPLKFEITLHQFILRNFQLSALNCHIMHWYMFMMFMRNVSSMHSIMYFSLHTIELEFQSRKIAND